ncbi:MAG TPA: hypothetical protein VD834_12495 [Blastococcus sp.]|nr:hypothetical protein [Blastococcus sp.]
MRPRSPARARFLGLWSAGWLAALLVLAMLRLGDPAVQWPVLLVPALWALVALRPRRGSRRSVEETRRRRRPEPSWEPDQYDDDLPPLPPGRRTDTVERPALRRPYDPRENGRR